MVDTSRLVTLASLYVAYVMHTYSRRSFQNIINYIINEKSLTVEAIGVIVTTQQIGYTMSKFVQPFIIDHVEPKIFLVMTMFVSFICTLSMSYSTTPFALTSFYWLHGFCLAFAWPSVAKILKSITVESEFGLWWSVLCTSSNLGAIIGSIISTLIADNFGWRNNLKFIAAVNLICGLMISMTLMLSNTNQHKIPLTKTSVSKIDDSRYRNILLNPVLTSNGILIFSVYVTRYVISDWYQIHLSSMKFTQLSIASFISMMEIGGIIGTLIAGIAADFCFINFQNWKNPRMFVLIIFGALTASIEHILIFRVDSDTTPFHLTLMGFFFGLFMYGPVAISGIIAIEAVPPENQGLSLAINIIYANLAMLVAGYPLSYLGYTFGWKVSFIISYIGICFSTLLVMVMRNFPTIMDDLETAAIDSS